jgi:hypothetical protein
LSRHLTIDDVRAMPSTIMVVSGCHMSTIRMHDLSRSRRVGEKPAIGPVVQTAKSAVKPIWRAGALP